jgi:Xaa-Pro aminopeptidase
MLNHYQNKPTNVPRSEISRRQEKIQKELRKSGINALLVVQPADLYYITGLSLNGFFYLPAREQGREPSRGKGFLALEHKIELPEEASDLFQIRLIEKPEQIPGLIIDLYGALPRVLGFEFDVLPVNVFNKYRTIFPDQKCVDGSAAILNVRKIKSAWEIERLEKIGEIFQKTFAYAKEIIKPGLTEMEFSALMEAYAAQLSGRAPHIRVRDYLTEGYPFHILSGYNGGRLGLLDSPASGEGTSAAFPSGAGNKPLAENEPIMVDFAFEVDHYHMDVTRMFAIGSMPDEAMRASEAAIEIHNAVIEKAKPGIALEELFNYSVSKAETLGYADSYLGPKGYQVTFIAHGVGVELVEAPLIAKGKKDLLEAGMTFALEPKIVYQDQFIAGIESVCLVTDTGCRLLSPVPVEVFKCFFDKIEKT